MRKSFTAAVSLALAGFGVALPAAAEDGPGRGAVAADAPAIARPAPAEAAAYLRIIYGGAARGAMPADPLAGKGPAAGPPHGEVSARGAESAAQRSRGLTRAVQAGLLAAGHDPGPLDGVTGPNTRAAIRAFQRQHGLDADGKISSELIEALLGALGAAPRAPLPANAHRIPFLDDWACDRFYRRNGNRCERTAVPANATPGLIGHSWTCDHGYRRVGNRCEKLAVPRNARPWRDVLGDGWVCNRGYRRIGDQCDRVPIPRNATRDLHGAGWTCNRRYRRAGNSCIWISPPERPATCCGIRPRR